MKNRSHHRSLLLALLSSVALPALSSAAEAACAPDPVEAGGTVICSDTDTNGFSTGNEGVNVNVTAGASVGGGTVGINIGNKSEVTVASGAVVTGSSTGISAGSQNIIRNEGAINSANEGINVFRLNGVHNAGTIKADIGIHGGSENAPYLEQQEAGVTNTGKIEAVTAGVWLGSSSTVVNHGEISATLNAIKTDDHNHITNWGTLIAGEGGQAILVTRNSSIRNYNTIESLGGGIKSGDFSDILNDVDGVINATGIAIEVDQFNTVVNNGSVTGSIGIHAEFANSIVNAGNIHADYGIESLWADDILNTGTIKANLIGINVGLESRGDGVVNKGTIESGFDGIVAFSDNEISNEGKITAAHDGVVLGGEDKQSLVANDFSNSGTVTAGNSAIFVRGGDQNLTNTGSLIGKAMAISGGSGVETIINGGFVDGDMVLGDGDDVLVMADQSLILGDIDGGAGADSIMASSGLSVFAGKITNVETLAVEGLSWLELDGGSAIGSTVVEAGGIAVMRGSLQGDVFVDKAGGFLGMGTLDGDLESAGMTGTNGFSKGTLTIDGNYSQASTGEFHVSLGAASSDKFVVTGSAALDGTLSTGLLALDPSALEGKSYTILTAGSITGAFDNTGSVQQGFWTLNVQQSGTAVTVTVTDIDLTIGASAPVTTALANAIGTASGNEQSPDSGVVNNGVVISTDIIPIDPGTITKDGDQQSASLDYDSLGDWESAAPSFVSGWSEMGARTPAATMPKTGTGEFEGTTRGELTETGSGSPEAFVVEGNVLLTANFASGLVNADFTEMEKIDSSGLTSAWVDFRARMSIASGTSEFAGTAGTDDGVWNGEARGGFYGDDGGMPGHAAGLWSMSSPLGQAIGGFMAKRR